MATNATHQVTQTASKFRTTLLLRARLCMVAGEGLGDLHREFCSRGCERSLKFGTQKWLEKCKLAACFELESRGGINSLVV